MITLTATQLLFLFSALMLVIHIILTVIVLIKLRKSGHGDVVDATKTIFTSIGKACGISNINDLLNLAPEVAQTVKLIISPPADEATETHQPPENRS